MKIIHITIYKEYKKIVDLHWSSLSSESFGDSFLRLLTLTEYLYWGQSWRRWQRCLVTLIEYVRVATLTEYICQGRSWKRQPGDVLPFSWQPLELCQHTYFCHRNWSLQTPHPKKKMALWNEQIGIYMDSLIEIYIDSLQIGKYMDSLQIGTYTDSFQIGTYTDSLQMGT